MAQSNNYIIVHADGKRYLSVSPDGRTAWTYNPELATRFSQSRALYEICRHGLSAEERKYSDVRTEAAQKEAVAKRQPEPTFTPLVILRLVEGSVIKYLYRYNHRRQILSFTSLARNARTFKTFDEAQEFIRQHRYVDPRIEKMMPVHENVAHVAENVLTQRPSQDSRIQQVVEQFNLGESIVSGTVRVWTFPNPRSTTGISMVVTVEDKKLSQLDAWERLRKIYSLKVAFPIACSEYTGKKTQKALKLAQGLTQLKI